MSFYEGSRKITGFAPLPVSPRLTLKKSKKFKKKFKKKKIKKKMKIFFEDLKIMIFKIDLQYEEKYMQRHLQGDLQKKSSKVILQSSRLILKRTVFKCKICIKNMVKNAFFPMSFLHLIAVFYENTVIHYRQFFNVKNTAERQWKT